MDLTKCNKVIVFGGSFDPPHIGHVELPTLAMNAVAADTVIYVPTGRQPLKPQGTHASATHRLAMLQLALQSCEHAVILKYEIDRDPDVPSYTADTLEALCNRLGSDVTMRLLIGADQLQLFNQWRHWQQIVELAEPLVMVRPPYTCDSLLASLPEQFSAADWRTRLLNLPIVDVSSRKIRKHLTQGKSIDGLVPLQVSQYIDEHGLYRA